MKNDLSLSIHSELNLLPRGVPSQRVLEIRIQAPDSPVRKNRPPMNLALVLDRSGSMAGNKLDFVKQAAEHVVNLMQAGDRMAVVSYDDEINVVSPSSLIDESSRTQLIHRIRQIETGGMTNLSGGWLQGAQEVADHINQNSLHRTLLLTDGLANKGITDPEVLQKHAKELADREVSTSTFGVGDGFNEHLLEGMSNQGGGNFYYIGNPREIADIFQREFTNLASITARGVILTLEFPIHTALTVLGDWRNDIVPGQAHIYLGDLTSSFPQNVYVKVLFPPQSENGAIEVRASVAAVGIDQNDLQDSALLAFQYEDESIVQAAPVNIEILQRYARVDMAQVANEALKFERKGEFEKARQIVKFALAENLDHLSREDAQHYNFLADRIENGMSESDRKTTHFQSYNQKRGREG